MRVPANAAEPVARPQLTRGGTARSREDRIPFELPNGTSGTAKVLMIELPEGRTLVVCSDGDEDLDAPVNMAVEQLFRTVCQRHRLDPTKVEWVEYTNEILEGADREIGGLERVTWHGGLGHSPDWNPMTPQDWHALGTQPPPGLRDLNWTGA